MSLASIAIIATILFSGFSPTIASPQPSTCEPFTFGASTPSVPDPQDLEVWEYWQPADVKGLDPWGDAGSKVMDIVAVYEKEETDALVFRLDFMDLVTDVITPTYFALDFTGGGSNLVEPGNISITFDVSWDVMVGISGTQFTLYDPAFAAHPDLLHSSQIDRTLDFISFAVARQAFAGWDGSAFQIQALATNSGITSELDRTAPVSTGETTGRGKLVLTFVNSLTGYGPHAVSWYDGYELQADKYPGVRRGCRYLLDAVETYQLPLTFMDLIIDNQASNEYLRINHRFRGLARAGLLDALADIGYGHFMAWQPDDVDAKAIEIATQIRQDLNLPMSTVFWPYEGMITPGDIQVIQDAGFGAIFGEGQYRYWFGWIEDWSDPEIVKADIESLRKVHLINGMPFVFSTHGGGNYQGFFPDERWGEINWDEYDEYEQYRGTDQGLDLWWRRVLHDLAMDPDQEQFWTIGGDIQLTPWMFPDIVNWNFEWLASHPWIEVTTFADILNRNWQVIDHGNLGLAPDELLIQHPLDGDTYYNAYFPEFYYGGTSDGHSPLIPAGEEIEAYYDYVPYLRDGQPIPSGRIMGDGSTPGSVVYETLHNLRAAPDNDLTRLAWQAYLVSIWEQTFHAQTDYAGAEPEGDDWGGKYLHPHSKRMGNKMLQVNKIVAAANWASATTRSIPAITQALSLDLDLDGEDEYVLYNDQVYAIFEDDGARLEYAFATSPDHAPVQLIAPEYQLYGRLGNYEQGEIGELGSWSGLSGAAFIEDLDGDYALEYALYQATIENDALVFSTTDYGITKTFTLTGGTITAHYELAAPTELSPSFGLAANVMNMFTMDWSEKIERVQMGNAHGWQTTDGGLALVDFTDFTECFESRSFTDSPARDEGFEREDHGTYPAGHGFYYPQNLINTYACGNVEEFYVSLTLGADPLRRVFVPLVTKND